MLALDGFCGKGGWTKGLQAAGFIVDGFDSEPQPDYPGNFIQADARTFHPDKLYDVVVMSPPCQGFSQMNRQVLEGKRPAPLDFELVAHALRIIREAGPQFWAVENVRGAVPWFRPIMGDPKLKNAPWFIWGNFPDFITAKDKMHKYANNYGTQDWRDLWAKASKRHRAAVAAEIPAALAYPFAQACMDAWAAIDEPEAVA